SHPSRVFSCCTSIPTAVNYSRSLHDALPISGENHTSFVDETPELFEFPVSQDWATKLLTYIGDIVVNGFPGIGKVERPVYAKPRDRKSTRLNSSHVKFSYAVFCLKKTSMHYT